MNIIPTQIDSLTIGGRVLTDLENLKILLCHPGGTTNESTGRLASASAGYQVPTGSVFKVVAVRINVLVVGQFYIDYSNNDVGPYAAGGSKTGVTYPGGDIGLGKIHNASVVGVVEIPYDFEIPAGKYLGVDANGGGGGPDGMVQIFGYEVPA